MPSTLSRRRLFQVSLAATGMAALRLPRARAKDQLDGASMPYVAFSRLPHETLEIGGGRITVGFGPGQIELTQVEMLAWIERSARAVSLYYGRFPVKELKLLVLPVEGGGVPYGQTWGDPAAIRIRVGSAADEAALIADWVMVHEMVHLAFPRLGLRHNWLAEGLAVYVESIARIHAGDLTEDFVWREFRARMPKGLPQTGDQGLDHTPTWGRTYWGGAIFCLLADVGIRQRTDNAKGLQHALRAVNAAADFNTLWPVERALATADAGVGGSVLMDLYKRMKDKPDRPDLDALWSDLGIVVEDGALRFMPNAPLAATRVAICSPT
jgi:hypothetical protein